MDRTDAGGGGMTGATGDLTPEGRTDPFVPGESREIAGDEERARVTAEHGATAPAQLGETGDPGWGPDTGDATDAPRDSGYGSQAGLSPEDPAYRMERHAPPPAEPPVEERGQSPAGETRIGGDELAEREERF